MWYVGVGNTCVVGAVCVQNLAAEISCVKLMYSV